MFKIRTVFYLVQIHTENFATPTFFHALTNFRPSRSSHGSIFHSIHNNCHTHHSNLTHTHHHSWPFGWVGWTPPFVDIEPSWRGLAGELPYPNQPGWNLTGFGGWKTRTQSCWQLRWVGERFRGLSWRWRRIGLVGRTPFPQLLNLFSKLEWKFHRMFRRTSCSKMIKVVQRRLK